MTAPYAASSAGGPGSTATPLYDALVSEYRQALRCVPGEYRFDTHPIAEPAGAASPAFAAHVPGFHNQFDGLAYARRGHGVPRQVSRHRGTPEDGQGLMQAVVR